MKKNFDQLYYLKMLYFNAGKNMLTDNFQYYKNLVINTKIISVVDKIMQCDKDVVCLEDDTGCRAHRVLEELAEKYRQCGDVYLFEDDHCAGKLSAVYSLEGVFAMHSTPYLFPAAVAYNLNNCYKPGQRRKYTSRQYADIAKYYYEKSECIEKNRSL